MELVGIRIPTVGEELNVAEMVDQGFTSLPAAGDILENYFFSSSAHIEKETPTEQPRNYITLNNVTK